ncbi:MULTISPECIES: 4'-phosphopantetheinyl transferase superfamily protein [unclassified Candidatus Cardinium]|uniref:4'-phosphopantetheinyl transferase family protein n=1 Tax=unclassified Candidatus Cardinium TaxID=2641185 RepID=UPI001FB398E3|nr:MULTISPECIES: 4'-phosphopantetheinyl transferase superfamily protein [unclassified Candidatus Cardinium]
MPVYSFCKLSTTTFCLIGSIQASLPALRAQLSPEFLADFQCLNLSSEDRIRQSLSVRVLLCCLLKKLGLPILPLSKNQQGRPILENSNLHISFAHTRYIAAVALSTAFPIGIDIETIKPSLAKIQSKFLTDIEAKNANNCLETLAIYWAGKETLYKRLDGEQMATSKNIFIEPFDLQTEGKLIAHLSRKKYTMGYQQLVAKGIPSHVLVYSKT